MSGRLQYIFRSRCTFTATKGTLFYRRQTPTHEIPQTLAPLAEGNRISSVTLNDESPSGMADVKIYRSFAGYPSVVVATTNQDDYYATAFQPVPSNENVTVWIERDGYTFEPAQYNWRHYFGYRAYRLDFNVKSVAVTATTTLTPTPMTEVPPSSTPISVPPTPTATSPAGSSVEHMRLNKIMPAPQNVAWNHDGSIDTQDEWIEVVNLRNTAINIGGWSLDTNGSEGYSVPIGEILQPRQYAVFYDGQTGLALADDAGQVRLKDAQGRMIERVRYEAISFDGSNRRDDAGNWHVDWPPSPGVPIEAPGNIIAQATEPSRETSEAALRVPPEQLLLAVWNLIDSIFC